MRHLFVFCAFVGCLLVSTAFTARAEVRAGDVTITPMVGYHLFDGGLDIEDSGSFGLALGYNFTPNWAVELDARFIPTEADSWHGPDIDSVIGSVNALYHLAPERELVPYLAVGGGAVMFDIDDRRGNDKDWIANYGGGIKYAVARNLNLRLDVRHILEYVNDSGDEPEWRHQMSAMVGLNFQFGQAPAQPAAAVEPVVTKAASVAPPAPPVPQDSDKDGVFAPADSCPDTPPGVRVDADGCPADSDGDGIADFRDACIDTPKGAKVDDKGCPFVVKPVETLSLRLVYATNRDQVTPFHYRELDRAADFIKKYPGHDIVIEGHTDSKGDDDFNLKLSQRRAENVRTALIEKYGVDAARISAQGFGESRPVASNETADGREQNRRVVISILP